MHLQLPGTLLSEIGTAASHTRPEAPECRADVLDRVVLNRPARKVKFYFRKNRCKRCHSELTPEQMKALVIALHRNAKDQSVKFVFEEDHYLLTPETKRFVW